MEGRRGRRGQTSPGEERGNETGKVAIAHGSVECCEAAPIGLADESYESLYGRETDRDHLRNADLRRNPKTLRGLARALSESALQRVEGRRGRRGQTSPGEERGNETGKVAIAHGSVECCEAAPIGLADESQESLYGRETDRGHLRNADLRRNPKTLRGPARPLSESALQ